MNYFTTPIPVTPIEVNQTMNQPSVIDTNQNQLLKNQILNDKNYQSILHYIDNLFSRYARLMVIRLDLGYRKDAMIDLELYQAYWQAKYDKEHLFNNMRTNQIFNHMVGYIWRLEYTEQKGFHYHLIFFFDGSKVKEDISHATMIGEYWVKSITEDSGLYHNCNLHKEKYTYCGIGMINYYDTVLINNLKYLAQYLVKPDDDMIAFMNSMNIGRTFGRGTLKQKTETRGRPRMLNETTLVMPNVS